jgi:hypothetical protein
VCILSLVLGPSASGRKFSGRESLKKEEKFDDTHESNFKFLIILPIQPTTVNNTKAVFLGPSPISSAGDIVVCRFVRIFNSVSLPLN